MKTLQEAGLARLARYRDRRNFAKTPEPAGRPVRQPPGEGGLFVVHKHQARRLHYDLRLEHEGVLESWAVPKGPSRRKGDKRLAVHVEDHPLEYGDFEGVIPEGEYGGGTVMLWDRGHWRQTRRSEGRIDFELEGHKLRGAWTLTRMGGKDSSDWLLIKRSDTPAGAGAAALTKVPDNRSVASGRTMRQTADSRPAAPADDDSAEPPPAPETLAGVRAGRLPTQLHPQLATLSDVVPEGEGWVHEIKFDGYRILARVTNGRVRLISRNGKDWTRRFPEIATELAKLPVGSALLDGEVIALAADGTSSFHGLQEALSEKHTRSLVYQVFDLMHLNGSDLSRAALIDRKRLLLDVLARAGFVGSARIRYTEHLQGRGETFYQHARRLGLEGIICKRAGAGYRQGRSRQWLKVKCTSHEELLVGGFTEPAGSRSGFGALLLGAYDRNGRLVYAGRVGTGFTRQQLEALSTRLRRREIDECPFASCTDRRGVHWVRPELIVEVEFTGWTRDGLLRHPSFRGVREDKDPKEIRMDRLVEGGGHPRHTERSGGQQHASRQRGARRHSTSGGQERGGRVAGVALSNPERVLFPEQGATKIALAQFYVDIEDWILPQLRRRPLSLVRCPQGRGRTCFYQKHPGDAVAAEIPRIRIREKNGAAEYLYVESIAHLVALVQVGTLELHVWGSRTDQLERPDLVVFDLDPGRDIAWRQVIDAARSLRDRLEQLGLASFLRTTGGKGLHVVVPLQPKLEWDAVKAFARGVSEAHAADDPRRLTTNMSKAKREGRVFLDYLRNGRGATAIASYSTRARQGAPVAVPLRWDELGSAMTSDRYRLDNLRRRLSALRSDPWEGFDGARRPITRQLLNAVGVQR